MKLTISGNVPSQKNGKEIAINHKTGRRFIRSNDRVKEWQKSAKKELLEQFKDYRVTGYPIGVTLVFYFDNKRRHDLDNACAGVLDALKNCKIVEDDNVNFIDYVQLQYGGIDKKSPRVEIFLDD